MANMAKAKIVPTMKGLSAIQQHGPHIHKAERNSSGNVNAMADQMKPMTDLF